MKLSLALLYQIEIKMTSKENQSTTLTQIDKANETLASLRPNVSTQDREAAVQELKLSTPTISRYLNGDAKRLDKAISIIRFFRNRIEKRDRELAA